MGWVGIVVLGVAVGAAGWRLHPLRGRMRGGLGTALAAAVLGAVLAKAAGRFTGLFLDGETLEWPLCTALALICVSAALALRRRR